MRTAKPDNIRDDFVDGLDDIENAVADISAKGVQQGSRLHMFEHSFLAASILLEGFVGDLFVAYLNKKNGKFVGYLTGRMSIEAADELVKRAVPYASVDIGSHLTLEKIRKILDPKDWNVTFNGTPDLKAKAGQWLEQPYDAYFTGLSAQHGAVLEAVKATRNFLAHRSTASHATMQGALASADLPTGLRRGANKVNSPGSYFESIPIGGQENRLKTYISELRAIAALLCP